MSKRTTILLDDDVYERLVNESLRKYGTTKAMSKVTNELLKQALKGPGEGFGIDLFEKGSQDEQ